MTPAQLRTIRDSLGLTAEAFARLVGVSGGRTVRKWEAGDREIPGTVAILLKAIKDNPKYFGVKSK